MLKVLFNFSDISLGFCYGGKVHYLPAFGMTGMEVGTLAIW